MYRIRYQTNTLVYAVLSGETGLADLAFYVFLHVFVNCGQIVIKLFRRAFPVVVCLVVRTSASNNCLKILVSEMSY